MFLDVRAGPAKLKINFTRPKAKKIDAMKIEFTGVLENHKNFKNENKNFWRRQNVSNIKWKN